MMVGLRPIPTKSSLSISNPVPERGIRVQEWLYMRQPSRRKLLFDQNADPDELDNLVDDPHYSPLLDRFDAQLER